MKVFGITEAKNQLSALIDHVRHGGRLSRLGRARTVRIGTKKLTENLILTAPPRALKGSDAVQTLLEEAERLDLIEELWKSLTEDQRDSIPLTNTQITELDRRLDLLEKEGPIGFSPEELRERIKRQRS
ncbi:MAG: addiction module protein [Actinomycetota bacterium]